MMGFFPAGTATSTNSRYFASIASPLNGKGRKQADLSRYACQPFQIV